MRILHKMELITSPESRGTYQGLMLKTEHSVFYQSNSNTENRGTAKSQLQCSV